MVRQHHLESPRSAGPTLDVLWCEWARRLGGRAIMLCVATGVAGGVLSLIAERWMPLALSLIVAAFGCYAVIMQPTLGGRYLLPRAQRVFARVMGTVAVLAGVAAALLALAGIFGGSIEVMRR